MWSAIVISGVAIAGCGSGAGNKMTGNGGGGGNGSGGSAGTHVDAGTNASCSFTACGGDLVGVWRFTSICSTSPSTDCPPVQGITVDYSGGEASYTFTSVGMFTYMYSGTLSETIRYPLECIAAADAGVTDACSRFQASVQSLIHNPDAGPVAGALSSFTCSVDATQTCVCTEVFMYTPQVETGSYTVSGSQVDITITGASGVGDAGVVDAGSPFADYCVSGNTLKLHSANGVLLTLTK